MWKIVCVFALFSIVTLVLDIVCKIGVGAVFSQRHRNKVRASMQYGLLVWLGGWGKLAFMNYNRVINALK